MTVFQIFYILVMSKLRVLRLRVYPNAAAIETGDMPPGQSGSGPNPEIPIAGLAHRPGLDRRGCPSMTSF